MSKGLTKPDSLTPRKIAKLIIEQSPRFELVIERAGLCQLGTPNQRSSKKESNFSALASSILSQQLSTKAAATINGRVAKLSGGSLVAKNFEQISVKQLRKAGCSSSKARAIKELAQVSNQRIVPMSRLHLLDDEEIMSHLLPLYGIGQWTVEMFLMFQLGRQDVWPVGDLGVRRGWEKIHRMRSEVTPKRLHLLGEPFAPHRSHVAWYCWRATEVL